MPFSVYILQSDASGRLYIGHTQNLKRRLYEHNAGQTRSTRGRGPWTLLHAEAFPSRPEAVQCERMLKRMKKPARVLDWIGER